MWTFLFSLFSAALAHNALQQPMRMYGAATEGPISAATFPCAIPSGQLGSVFGSAAVSNTYRAGEQVAVQFSSGTYHGGGSCQYSLSYDLGVTWKVVQTNIGDCPSAAGASIQLPANLPAGDAIFSWTWMPKLSGGPEFYMSCSKVAIQGSGSANDLAALPDMFVGVVNDCIGDASSGTLDIVFPNPGSNVVTSAAMAGKAPGYGLGTGCQAQPSTQAQTQAQQTQEAQTQAQTQAPQTQTQGSPAVAQTQTVSPAQTQINAPSSSPISTSIGQPVVVPTSSPSSDPITSWDQCNAAWTACNSAWIAAGASGSYTCQSDYVSCQTAALSHSKRSFARRHARHFV